MKNAAFLIRKNKISDTDYEIRKVPDTARLESGYLELGNAIAVTFPETNPPVREGSEYQDYQWKKKILKSALWWLVEFSPWENKDGNYTVVNLSYKVKNPEHAWKCIDTMWEKGDWANGEVAVTDQYVAVYRDGTIRPLTVKDVMDVLGDKAHEMWAADVRINLHGSDKSRVAKAKKFEKIIADLELGCAHWTGFSENVPSSWQTRITGPKSKIMEAKSSMMKLLSKADGIEIFDAPSEKFDEAYQEHLAERSFR